MQLIRIFTVALLMLATLSVRSASAITPDDAQKLYDRVTPSLVAVQYVWQNELNRVELTGAGIVVSDDGLVMAPMILFPMQFPDSQLKEFKILVPREDGEPTEYEAVFQGRDPRTDMAFVKTKEPQHWRALTFAETDSKVGQSVFSVGMLPKNANYKTYFVEGQVGATLRGETPQVLVMGGGLAALGSPVFDTEGQAIGIVLPENQNPLLNEVNPRDPLAAINRPPKLFVPSKFFQISIKDPPTPEHPVKLPWLGVAEMTGVNKDVAEVYGLGNQPAIQIGDVVPNAPAEKAGLKPSDIIVKVNDKPLERGDEPAELPGILSRRLMRLKPGDNVTLTVLRDKDQPLKNIAVTLDEQPMQMNLAKRYYADDLGFGVRELVFSDRYTMKLPLDQKGVIVALLKPQGSAQSGGLHNADVITKLNSESVTDVGQFEKSYKAVRKEKPTDAIVLQVHRGDGENTIRIEPPR